MSAPKHAKKKSTVQLNREIAEALGRHRGAHATVKAAKSKHTDLIFRNAMDTRRVRIFRRESGRWDYDVFTKGRAIETYSTEAGDDFATRAAAKWQEHGCQHPDQSHYRH